MTKTVTTRGQGRNRSLVKAKEFQVPTEFHEVVSRQCIFLCCDRVLAKTKGSLIDIIFLCRNRVGQARSFLSRQNILRRDRVWSNGKVLCCDRAILCRDIVSQAGKIFYRD